jgi:hypothetical protein
MSKDRNRNPFGYSLELASVGVATTYYFHGKPHGWASCTVNDATGELLITSDWGNMSNRWPSSPKALGRPTITDCIGRSWGVEYMTGKLLAEDRRDQCFDIDATVAEFRRRLCEQRLLWGREPEMMERGIRQRQNWRVYDPHPHGLTEHRAREIWEEIDSLASDVGDAHESCSTLFLERLMNAEWFSLLDVSEPWERLRHRPSLEADALIEFILPALKIACAATCDERERAVEASKAGARG